MGRPRKTAAEKLGEQMPLRLSVETDRRLREVAKSFSIPKSALIRMLADTFVQQAVGPGGVIQLPLNWRSLIESKADGRSGSAYSSAILNEDAGSGNNFVTQTGKKNMSSPYPKRRAPKKRPKI